MKYNELHRKLRAAGCYEIKQKGSPHPVWYSPITGEKFTTGHHGTDEVATGTLMIIGLRSGVKLKKY